jgi:hypothetical protein
MLTRTTGTNPHIKEKFVTAGTNINLGKFQIPSPFGYPEKFKLLLNNFFSIRFFFAWVGQRKDQRRKHE